jgi:glutathione synthase/RimK-type ligase-like ATP-grasp enzyme
MVALPLNVLFGIPNRSQRTVRVSPDGRHLLGPKPDGQTIFIGSVNLARHLDPQRFALERFYLRKGAPLRPHFGPGPFLNHIADPDTCSGALELAERVVTKLSRPCFNRPAAVARTTRHEVAHTLTGIAGLTVPKTIRVQYTTPSAIRETIVQAGLVFPVLLRGVGMHGGMSLVKANRPDDIEELAQLSARRGLYVTEFRDFRSRDGRYRKFRVVVVGGEIYLRHCIIADNWMLHATRRAEETGELERAMFTRFEREWASQVRSVFREIAMRLRLDFFGVDCNINEDGGVLLFEANACMNILRNTSPSPNMWDAPIASIKRAVEERLAAPSTWYAAISR